MKRHLQDMYPNCILKSQQMLKKTQQHTVEQYSMKNNLFLPGK